jgi:hypothetical protein
VIASLISFYYNFALLTSAVMQVFLQKLYLMLIAVSIVLLQKASAAKLFFALITDHDG